MHTTRNLRLALAAPVLAAAVAGLAACGGSGTETATGTAGPAGVSTSAPAASTTTAATSTTAAVATTTRSGSSGSSGSSGACRGSGSIPKGAGTATTVDLDGDGRKDTIWLADVGSKRELGVRTAGGAVFSTTFTSAAPQAARAVAGVVAGGRVILLDTGRSVQLYAVNDCRIDVTKNAQGEQYTFDKGFTGYGTGVGCPEIGSGRRLAGFNAKAVSGGRFDVTRTLITLSGGGTRATNGTTTSVGTGLSASNVVVKAAQSVKCGSSGGTASEPRS